MGTVWGMTTSNTPTNTNLLTSPYCVVCKSCKYTFNINLTLEESFVRPICGELATTKGPRCLADEVE